MKSLLIIIKRNLMVVMAVITSKIKVCHSYTPYLLKRESRNIGLKLEGAKEVLLRKKRN